MRNDFSNYSNLLRALYCEGNEIMTRNLETKELRQVLLEVKEWNCVSSEPDRPWKAIKAYLFAELAWYMTGERSIERISYFSKFWEGIANSDGTANSNYGDLVFYRSNSYGYSSFFWAYESLLEDKNTRKAICLYNDRKFFFSSNKDLICNQYQHFFIRNNKLDCDVCLRSSDAIFGLTFNIPWWSLVHQQLYLMLKEKYPELRLGNITAFIGSSHIYQNKYELVRKMLNSGIDYRFMKLNKVLPLGMSFEFYKDKVFKDDSEYVEFI